MIEVRQATEADTGAWVSFVSEHHAANIFHDINWVPILSDTFSAKPVPLVAFMGDRLIGIAISYIPMGLFHPSEVATLPGGILSSDDRASARLLEELKEIGKRENRDTLLVKGGLAVGLMHPTTIIPQIHSILETGIGAEDIWSGFTSNLRRKIRKANKYGYKISSSNEIPNEFLPIFQENQHRLGTPVISGRFFTAINENLRGKFRFIGLYRSKRLCAGCVISTTHSQWESLYVACRKNDLAKYAMYCLYWGMIQESVRSGAKWLDFGRSRQGSGNLDFKRQWYSNDLVVPYMAWDLRTSIGSPHNEQAPTIVENGNQKNNFQSELWKRLPLSLANQLGPIIRRNRPFG